MNILRPLLATLIPAVASAAPHTIAYVGTYTGGKSRGIYAYRVESGTAGEPRFVALGLAAATPSPAFLAIDPARHRVFAVNETDNHEGQPTGAVSAFSADPVTGKLTLINQQPSHGKHPCHLVLDPAGKFLLVANYSSGTVAVYPVAADGRLGGASDVVQHAGSGPVSGRQDAAHAHCVTFDPAGKFVFICDLGLDRVVAYRLDAAGKLLAEPAAGTTLAPGAGPRHLVFSANARFAYVLNELASTVTALRYDAATGAMSELQTLSSLPADFTGQKWAAELALHPNGKWLYASNRGHDSIALFSVDPDSGRLTYVAAEASGGKTPRYFALLPDGRQLVAANQDSDGLRFFRVDPASGRLEPLAQSVEVPEPVFVGFMSGGSDTSNPASAGSAGK